MTRNMTFLSFKWSRCFAPRRPRPPTMTRCRLYVCFVA